MKRRLLCLLLFLTLVIAIPVAVTAESSGSDGETIDWDAVDWETYDWKTLDMGEESASLSTWLKTEASFAKLFAITRNCSHAAYSETLVDIICDRFMENPEGFLIALAKEDEAVQENIIKYNLFSVLAMYDPNAMVAAIEGIQLNQETHPEAVELMLELIKVGEEKLNISIEIPKTGDPVLLTVALALLSASGLAVLYKKREDWK